MAASLQQIYGSLTVSASDRRYTEAINCISARAPLWGSNSSDVISAITSTISGRDWQALSPHAHELLFIIDHVASHHLGEGLSGLSEEKVSDLDWLASNLYTTLDFDSAVDDLMLWGAQSEKIMKIREGLPGEGQANAVASVYLGLGEWKCQGVEDSLNSTEQGRAEVVTKGFEFVRKGTELAHRLQSQDLLDRALTTALRLYLCDRHQGNELIFQGDFPEETTTLSVDNVTNASRIAQLAQQVLLAEVYQPVKGRWKALANQVLSTVVVRLERDNAFYSIKMLRVILRSIGGMASREERRRASAVAYRMAQSLYGDEDKPSIDLLMVLTSEGSFITGGEGLAINQRAIRIYEKLLASDQMAVAHLMPMAHFLAAKAYFSLSDCTVEVRGEGHSPGDVFRHLNTALSIIDDNIGHIPQAKGLRSQIWWDRFRLYAAAPACLVVLSGVAWWLISRFSGGRVDSKKES